MKKVCFILVALAAFVALPAGAQTPSPAAPAKPLRHLVFSLTLATNYLSELRGVKDISNNVGASGATTQSRDRAEGTIVCDVVAARDNGDLMIDVSETLRGQTSAVSRIVLHADGQIDYLPNQKLLAAEAALLMPFLARNYIGSQAHAAGEAWTIDDSLANYKATTKLKIDAVRSPSDLSLELEQTYTLGGAQPSSGVIRGHAIYDPSKVVLNSGSFDTRARTQQGDHYEVISSFLEFALKEDSFARR